MKVYPISGEQLSESSRPEILLRQLPNTCALLSDQEQSADSNLTPTMTPTHPHASGRQRKKRGRSTMNQIHGGRQRAAMDVLKRTHKPLVGGSNPPAATRFEMWNPSARGRIPAFSGCVGRKLDRVGGCRRTAGGRIRNQPSGHPFSDAAPYPTERDVFADLRSALARADAGAVRSG